MRVPRLRTCLRLATLASILGGVALAHAAVPEWVTSAAHIPTPEYAATARAVVLLDSSLVTMTGPNDITTRRRRAVRLLGSHVGDVTLPTISYDSTTKLLAFRGWSVAADGKVSDVKEREAIESSPWGELYGDSHVKSLPFPSNDPGTVVVYEYEQRDRTDFPQTTWNFQGDLPVATAELTLQLAPNWTYEPHWFRHAGVTPVSDPRPVWRLTNVPAIRQEPHMPAFSALAGRLGLLFEPLDGTSGAAGSKPTWSDVARWFDRLAAGRCTPTAAIQAKVRELAPATAAPLDRARALAAFTQRDVRYVAIEIGIGGYQPHPAGDIFSKHYGDCKDKVTLLRSMLREAGIDSYYVIVNATRGIVDPAFPGPGTFNHAIIAFRLPSNAPDLHATIDHPKLGKLLIFDPTSSSTPLGVLPLDEQGGYGLLVTGDGGELITLPVAPPRANQLRRTAKLQLDADGTLHGDVEETRSGELAAVVRDALGGKTEAQRAAYVDSAVAAHLTKGEVSGLTIEHVDDASSEVVIRYKLVARDYISNAGRMTLVRPRVLGRKADLQIDAARKFPYVTDGPALHTDDVEITIPPALRLDELPPRVRIAIAPLSYTSETKFDGTKLTYHREYALQVPSIEPTQVGDLNRAFAKIASDERSTAVFLAP